MPRGRKPKGQPETGLVARPVVEATFDDELEHGAMSHALAATSELNVKLVELMMGSYKDQALVMKIMSDTFTDSLKAQVEATKAQQDLLDKKDERRIKRRREEQEHELKKEILGQISLLGPLIVKKFTGVKMAPTDDVQGLQKLIESLNEKQLGAIFSVFNESQQAAFIELLKDAKEDVASNKETPPNGTSH